MRRIIPLLLRKQAAALIGHQKWLRGREWIAMEMVRDLAHRNPAQFHKFLWSNHIGYAATYEPQERFGEERIHPTRGMLFHDLCELLRERGVDPATDIRSVYEVGCSMGYLLRHLEQNVFRSATRLEGSDIDGYAIDVGSELLAAEGSRVSLRRADMRHLDVAIGSWPYDVILCAGVLMYLPEHDARQVVASILRHSAGVVAFAGLAHPERDNADLEASDVRARDHTFIHNIDAFVEAAGGRVLRRRWEGSRIVSGNTVYFVFCEPAGSPAAASSERVA